MKRIASFAALLVVFHALAAAGAEAQGPVRPADAAELVLRLEQAEARIRTLEDADVLVIRPPSPTSRLPPLRGGELVAGGQAS